MNLTRASPITKTKEEDPPHTSSSCRGSPFQTKTSPPQNTMIPTAPHTILQNHTLPPTEWGSPQTKSFAEGGEHWTALNDTSLLSKSRTATLASHFSSTLAACEGFVMQKVSVPHANNTGSMLTWQQRYIILSPGQGSITLYNIAPGQVVVSRPTTKGNTQLWFIN